MSKLSLVKVEWVDAETPNTDWLLQDDAESEARKPLGVCTSVGFLFFKGKDHITLSHTDGSGQHKLAIKIPKKWIISIQKI